MQNVPFYKVQILRDTQGQYYVNVVCLFDKPGVALTFAQQGADPQGRPRFVLQYGCPQGAPNVTPQSRVLPIAGAYAGGQIVINGSVIDEAPEDDFKLSPCPM